MKIIIAEKPSVAKTIAKFFGATKPGDGCITGDGVAVTFCFGHLLEQATPEAYDEKFKKWDLGLLPIVPSSFKLLVKDDCKKQVKIIGELLNGATEIIHAGDPDREGELLVTEVLEHFNCKAPVKRLWLAALDDESIKKAIATMKEGCEYTNLKIAAESRARADWLVGLNLTRAWTIYGRQFNHEVLSVGRVQTPTLGMIVRRDLEVENFKSRDFYQVEGSFPFAASWKPADSVQLDEDGRLLDKAVAQAIVDKVKNKPATISKYESKECNSAAPLPYSLSALQQKASAKFGLSAQEVLDIAQALYETHKVTSYPRTDCRYLPESMHILTADTLKNLGVAVADVSIKSSAFNDKKVTAHHAIIPTGKGSAAGLNVNEKKIYDLILKSYISQFYPDFQYQQVNILIDCQGESFAASGRTTIAEGWKVVFAGEAKDDDEEEALPILPKLAQGDSLVCGDAKVLSKKTTPPRHYTDGTLICDMTNVHKFVQDEEIKKRLRETAGIGTEATRAGIIETLIKRKFIEKKGKQLISTPAGRSLIAALGTSTIVDVGTTGLFEGWLDEIANGRLSQEEFLKDVVASVIKEIDLLKSSDAPIMVEGSAVKKDFVPKSTPKANLVKGAKCPKCQSGMVKRMGKNGDFLGCSTYPKCNGTAKISPG